MTYRPTLYISMREQSAPIKQSTLFDVAPDLEDLPPFCDHAVTEPQANLFGGTDEVCVTCGSRVAP
jgi:hypothetical protein